MGTELNQALVQRGTFVCAGDNGRTAGGEGVGRWDGRILSVCTDG